MENSVYLQNTLARVDNNNMTNLKAIRSLLVAIFGEENIQLKKADITHLSHNRSNLTSFKRLVTELLDGEYYVITLRFPEVLVKSETGSEHAIKNLFVKFNFNQRLQLVGEFQGMRSSYTLGEYNSNYRHSHLPRGNDVSFSKFCTGTGPINQSIALLRVNFDITNFQMFLYTIKSYVAWESISGVPYIRISEIRSSLTQIRPHAFSLQSGFLNHLVSKFLHQYSEEELLEITKPTIHQGFFIIKRTPLLEAKLGELIIQLKDQNDAQIEQNSFEDLTCFKRDSTYYKNITEDSLPSFDRVVAIRFKGVDYYKEIVSVRESSTQILAHPEITDYVIKRIRSFLTRTAIEINQES